MLCSDTFTIEALGRFDGRVGDAWALRFATLLAVLGFALVAVLGRALIAVLGRATIAVLGRSLLTIWGCPPLRIVLARCDSWCSDLSSRMLILCRRSHST
jgi:hypothetical protein